MYCKGLHLVYSFSGLAVSKCYTTSSHAVSMTLNCAVVSSLNDTYLLTLTSLMLYSVLWHNLTIQLNNNLTLYLLYHLGTRVEVQGLLQLHLSLLNLEGSSKLNQDPSKKVLQKDTGSQDLPLVHATAQLTPGKLSSSNISHGVLGMIQTLHAKKTITVS